MTRHLEISGAIELIYEAAQEPAHWAAALDRMARLLRADVALLYKRNERAEAPLFLGVYGAEFAAATTYATHFVDLDRRSNHMLGRPVGEVYSDEAHFDLATLKHCPAHNDFYRAQLGMEYVLGCHFEENGGGTFSASRSLPHGNFERTELNVANRILMPHVRRAFKIQRHLAAVDAVPRWSVAALDALPTALFIVNRDLRVIIANHAAEAMVADNKGLLIRRSILSTVVKRDTECLNFLVRLSWADRTLADPSPTPILKLNLPPRLQLMIAPVRSPSITGTPFPQLSFVFVVDPSKRQLPPEALLMALHGLTLAEASAALALASGRALPQIASDKDVKLNTIRTLLKRAMTKVGAHSQGQLVAEVMSGLGALGSQGGDPKK